MLRRKGLTIIYSIYVGKISKALEDCNTTTLRELETLKQYVNRGLSILLLLLLFNILFGGAKCCHKT